VPATNAVFSSSITEPIKINLNGVVSPAVFAGLPFATSGFADVGVINPQISDATGIVAYPLTVTETITLNDPATVNAAFNSNATEPTTLNNSSTIVTAFVSRSTENIGINDTPSTNAVINDSVIEAIRINLNGVVAPATFAGLPFGTSGFADVGIINQQVLDAIGLATYQTTITESTGINDTATLVTSFTSNIIENNNLNEASTGLPTYVKSVSESINNADSSSVITSFVSKITENANLNDVILPAGFVYASVSEDINVNDPVALTASFITNITEPTSVNNSAIGNSLVPSNITEAISVDSNIFNIAAFVGVVTENNTLNEINSVVTTFVSSATESINLNDFLAITTAFVSTAAENIGVDNTQSTITSFNSNITESISINLNVVKPQNTFAGLPFAASGFADVGVIELRNADASVVVVFNSSINELITLNDTPSTNVNFVSNTTEVSTLNDSIAVVTSFVSSSTENTRIVDAPSTVNAFSSSIVEDIGINLNGIPAANSFAGSPFAASGFADTTIIRYPIPEAIATAFFVSSISENSRLNDSNLLSTTYSGVVTEANRLNDPSTTVTAFMARAIEAANLNDLPISGLSNVVNVTENININLDGVAAPATFAGLPFGVSSFAGNTVPTSSTNSQTVLTIFSGNANEGMGLNESSFGPQIYGDLVKEPFNLNDLLIPAATFNFNAAELLTLADVNPVVTAFLSAIIENINADNSQFNGVLYVSSVSEILTFQDVIASIKTFNTTAIESITIDELLLSAGWVKINNNQVVTWIPVDNYQG